MVVVIQNLYPHSLKNSSTDQMDVAIKGMKIDHMSMSCELKIHKVPKIAFMIGYL